MSVYSERCERAQREMAKRGFDWLFIPHSTDLRYLLGYAHRQSERLTLLMLPRDGRPRLLLPAFEIPVVKPYTGFLEMIGWEEHEDPVERVGLEVGGHGANSTIACGDELHAVFLLSIQSALPEANFVPGREVMSRLRMQKDESELEALQTAARYTDQALESLLSEPMAGWTELKIRGFLHNELLRRGCESVGTGIVGGGPNSASPHHRTGERQVQAGDALVVDFGGSFRGYRSDMTRTFHVGKPTGEFVEVYEAVREAQARAVAAVGPGVAAEHIDQVARKFIGERGYGPQFLHRTGHGIGLDGHEYPYLVEGSKTILKPGMTFSVEPGIYLAGRFGVRIEDVVRVTESGVERLNRFSHDLIII